MTSNESYDLLSSLLPTTSFALAYALPLFLFSLALNLAGAFLTLDRTRIFTTLDTNRQPPKSQRLWLSSISWSLFLHGGVGGICLGYAFGGVCLIVESIYGMFMPLSSLYHPALPSHTQYNQLRTPYFKGLPCNMGVKRNMLYDSSR